jgi:hypothetical protein
LRLRTILLYCLAAVVAIFLLAEVVTRCTGYRPYVPLAFDFKVEPEGKFFSPHPSLGYTHVPGLFQLTLPLGQTFTVTHGADTFRLTEPPATTAAAGSRPEIWIFGCSITHGWSVNDQETYPWLLHERLPRYRVVNFAVGGYGTIHGLIQLEEALARGQRPRVAIAAYGAWHNTRNICSRLYRKAVIPAVRLGPLMFPCGRLDHQGRLLIRHLQLGYDPWPFMDRSALIHRLEEVYLKKEGKFRQSLEVTGALFLKMANLCRERGIIFVAAGIFDDPVTLEMMAHLKKQGIYTVDISVDPRTLERNYKSGHPNPQGHRDYADKLAGFLQAFPPLAAPGPSPVAAP